MVNYDQWDIMYNSAVFKTQCITVTEEVYIFDGIYNRFPSLYIDIRRYCLIAGATMSEMKQKNVRLPADITTRLEKTAKRFGLEETDIVRRALRSYLRQVEDDKDILFSKSSLDPLEKSAP